MNCGRCISLAATTCRRFVARCFLENDRVSVLWWDNKGRPAERPAAPFEGAGIIDADGDGVAEVLEDEPAVRRGDLDGDGTLERVERMKMPANEK